MATKLFLRQYAEHLTNRGTNTAKLDTTASGWNPYALSTTAGAGLTAKSTNTVAGPTNGVEVTDGVGGFPIEWLSDPLSADVTISGTITANIWCAESNMSANVAINVVIDRLACTDFAITNVVKSTRITEEAITTRAVANFTTGMTSGSYTGVAFNRGDRIRIRVFGDDAGTMGAGFTFSVGFNGGTGGADGDTFVSFTETITFESAPAGTQLFLTDVASDVSTASIDKEAWTGRGSGVTSIITNTQTGWVAPIQCTNTGGGTVVDWFTKQLTAFTLAGMAQGNICLQATGGGVNDEMGTRLEIARVDGDGTNATVWGIANIEPTASAVGGGITTTEAAWNFWVGGDDLSVSSGQRLRIRLYVDDTSDLPLVNAHSETFFYNGTSGGASGDSYLTLAQTVTQFVAATSDPTSLMTERSTPRRRSQQRW